MPYFQKNNFIRAKHIRDSHGGPPPAGTPQIKTLNDLHFWLQQAINVEHFTIPPYLCALYSLKDGPNGPNAAAFQVIRSVVMEEMLHMMLAANLLNAVGGHPRITDPQNLPSYPSLMPHSAIGFSVGLLKFCKDAVNTFLRIERPAPRLQMPVQNGLFWSIGEMYAAVREAINRLEHTTPNGIFRGPASHQVTAEHYYGGGGKLFAVGNLDDANRAIDEIVGQGEGIDGTIDDGDDAMFGEEMEAAHYFRFNEIFCERRYQLGDAPDGSPSGDPFPVAWDAVYNMTPNPKMSDFNPKSVVYGKMREFNVGYSNLLRTIQSACNGAPTRLLHAVPQMYALRDWAIELMNEESGKCDYTAGPSFEYIE